MNVIHLGSGIRSRLWIEAVERHSGARNAALASPDALERAGADVAVVSGDQAIGWAKQALQAKLAVILDEPGSVDRGAFHALQSAASAGSPVLLWPERYRYARCERVVRRLIDSGRLGNIGHVSCVDQAVAIVEGDRQSSHVSCRAFVHFESLRRLFKTLPKTIMARLGSEAGAKDFTEAFIEFESGLRVHYSGYSGASSDTHELWIESAQGSVKTDGSAVWWRKRGWHFFLPLKFGISRPPQDSEEARATLDAISAAQKAAAGSHADLSSVAAVAAAIESHRSRASVALSELSG